MLTYVEKIAEKLMENQRVILYGADTDALIILNELKKQCSLKLTCLCDSDSRKWYKSLLGVEILPPDKVISKFPDAYYFITSRLYKYQISGYLISSKNVLPNKILNYKHA